MATKNEHTGDELRSRVANENYADGWERIFKRPKPPYTCRFCGQPSWLEPIDQVAPPDYCHPSDHGEPSGY